MKRINVINNTWIEIPFDETKPFLDITEEQYTQLINGDLTIRSGKLVENKTKTIQPKIKTLKEQLAKCKEDVEQVELFGMQRDDYEQKKEMCKNIVLQLRELESQLKDADITEKN